MSTPPTPRIIATPELPGTETLRDGDTVIMPDQWGARGRVSAAAGAGARAVAGRYRCEDMRVTRKLSRPALIVSATDMVEARRGAATSETVYFEESIAAARAWLTDTWDALTSTVDANPTYTPATDFIPADWAAYLPYATYNPAQVEAIPAILAPEPALIVAPTGAGKTLLGMTAALQAILGQGRKAAWLVPQRSLTAELDRELDAWRGKGLSVVALSGEARTDLEATRSADLWVATTEKFEALCRNASMSEAIADIGVIVVDEIHLLGEPGRGPTLESLLVRIRTNTNVRLVGLSATATNAPDIAAWLGASLTTITWRPTRLTRQIVALPANSSRVEQNQRTQAATRIAQQVTRDGGSVLVFCGTKRNVRVQALALAAARGVDTTGIDANNNEAVHAATNAAGIGLHYSDWPNKRTAETDFRARRTNVLIATSTLAAGVNLPARAVIVRDTSIGQSPMEVSMVQQMFGRAGRAGMETEGWAFLLAPLTDVAGWLRRLTAGYTITSGIAENLEDHLLAEAVQGNITTPESAQTWWEGTLAHHQGHRDEQAVQRALAFLRDSQLLTGTAALEPSPLGRTTSRMMIAARDAAKLATRIQQLPDNITDPDTAERLLITTVCDNVEQLATGNGATRNDLDAALTVLHRFKITTNPRLTTNSPNVPANIVSAIALTLATNAPTTLNSRSTKVMDLPRTLLMPAIYDAPRYLAWIAALPTITDAPAWITPVAHDLTYRITWHPLNPPRGAGRILWAAERLTNANPQSVRDLYQRAQRASAPNITTWDTARDETLNTAHTRLTGALASTTTDRDGTIRATNGTITPPRSQEVKLWDGDAPGGGSGVREPVRSLAQETAQGGFVSSAQGDVVGFGWLGVYAQPAYGDSPRWCGVECWPTDVAELWGIPARVRDRVFTVQRLVLRGIPAGVRGRCVRCGQT